MSALPKPNFKDNNTLVTYLRDQLYKCVGYGANDKETQDRIDALNYYFQRPRGDEEEGASKVVSGDISSMVEASVANMIEAFATDSIAEFNAFDKDDEHQARLESEVIQDQLMGANNGVLVFTSAIKEACLFRLGVIKIWAEEFVRSVIKNFEGVTESALAAFAPVNLPPNVRVNILDFDRDKKTAKVRQIITRRHLRVASVPVENFLYIEDESNQGDIQRLSFVAERHVEPRSMLVERGFPRELVNKLSRVTTGRSREQSARTPGQFIQQPIQGIDPSQDLIEWFEAYALIDLDGDGISERHRISFHPQNLIILEQEPVSLVPYAIGTCIINPHKIRGVSLYDKLRQVQDINTGLKRALLDNATAVNQARIAYLDGKVNVDDLDSRRADRSIRVRATVNRVDDALSVIQIPDLTQGLLANIQHMRQERAEMGGAALEMATGQLRLNERLGSMGLDRAYSVMEQLSAHMCRIISVTMIRSAFMLAHETIRQEFGANEIVFKRAGRWVNVDPAQWPRRKSLTLKIAKSPNERARRKEALQTVLGLQMQLAQMGMDEILVNLDTFHHALIDLCRTMDLPNPEKYWIDPLDPNSIKARDLKAKSAAAEKNAQDELMKQAVELEELRTAFSKYQHDTELQFKYWERVLNSEIEEARITGNATTELLKLRKKANATNNGAGTGDKASESDTKE